MILFDKIKGWLIQLGNSEYRYPDMRYEPRRMGQRLNTKPKYLLCPHCFQPISLSHFQSNAQHRGQETTKKVHETGLEYEDCRETKE